jgi:hypothetical protein
MESPVLNCCLLIQGTWKWADGTPLDYTNWARYSGNHEPDGGVIENCMEVYGRKAFIFSFWNDRSCAVLQGYVCKAARK